MKLKKRDVIRLVLYDSLLETLKKECIFQKEVSRERILYILGVHYHVKKESRDRLIGELIEFNFIETKKIGHKLSYIILV